MPWPIRNLCVVLCLLSGLPSHAGNAGEPAMTDKAIKIGSRLELFVDRLLLDTIAGLEFRLHEPVRQPRPASPLVGAYATVIRDGDIFRAWYRDVAPDYDGPRSSGHPGEITCYAESRDGHEWTFPELGLFDVAGNRANNVVLTGRPPFSHNFSPFLDTRPGVPADERFKALAGHGRGGLHAFASPDGIRWRKLGDAPVILFDPAWAHAFDSQNVAFWSAAERRYVSYFRTWQALPGGGRGPRSISRATSPDFLDWDPPVALNPNLPGEQLYTNQTHPYFRAPHIYIALPTRFTRGNLTDILFMSARAGDEFYTRLFPEAFIRPGPDPERWGNRANYAALNVVPTGPGKMSIYHAKSGHRYVLRTDGFVSLRAGAGAGECLTKPVVFAGAELVLNLSTSAVGSVQVEIQAPDGRPVDGFALNDCVVIFGDDIENPVRWSGGRRLANLAGRPVRLRFVLREADLYSFRFR